MTTSLKDVVILLPGIMGSALAKDGKPIWDLTAGAVGRALYTLGDSIQDLALSSDASTGDDVTPIHLLQDVHIIPGLWKIDGYSGLSKYLKKRLKAVSGENYFEFPYDWRLDNRVSADRLKSAVLDWLESWRSRPGNQDAKLVLIAHSMGGLVARYFLEVLGGWKHTRTLITLGTPHRGSVKALDYLVNGLRKRIGPVTLMDLTAMIQSFPSVHQLLPIYSCVGENEQDLKRLEDLDELGQLDMDRAGTAIEFHREIERAVENNSANHPAYASSRYQLLPVVGTYQPTFQSALLTGDGVKPIRTYKGRQMQGGDGTVPRLSATPIELSKAKAEVFVACPHASLQNFDPVQVQLRATLEDVDISEIRAVAPEPVSLEMEDIFSSAERFRIRTRCDAALDPMHASITNIDTGETLEDELEFDSKNEEWQYLDRSPLPAGAYRIKIDPGGQSEPIADVFIVMD
jgi:pimeloyl-ACP methyl ester carboxylesterase